MLCRLASGGQGEHVGSLVGGILRSTPVGEGGEQAGLREKWDCAAVPAWTQRALQGAQKLESRPPEELGWEGWAFYPVTTSH